MPLAFRFIAVEPAVRLIFGRLAIGLYNNGRPALVYLDEAGIPVLHASICITNKALPRNALVIRRDGMARGFLEQLVEADHVIDLGEDIDDGHGNSGRLTLPVGALSDAVSRFLEAQHTTGPVRSA